MRYPTALVAVCIALACGDASAPPTVASVVVSAVVTPSAATLSSLGETLQLSATARDAN